MQPYEFVGDWSGQLVTTSIHAGHDLRPEVADLMVLHEADRLREEDPFTDAIGSLMPARVLVHRSRFEADLNRSRDMAVYARPEDCWGFNVWETGHLPQDVLARSLEYWDSFYAALTLRLDALAARGPFVIFDIHSYNHRRPGPDEPNESWAQNPELDLGTGMVDRERFTPVIDALRDCMATQGFDVRDEIKFFPKQLSQWVHRRYPGTGCVMTLEFKKTFMDEWTGIPDSHRLNVLAQSVHLAAGPVQDALAALPRSTGAEEDSSDRLAG
ncbi:N-formylglutamate amidohydrolase [Tessaracoccus antarcticus]|uniref:N-formylglutamate amidohydrolase n=1 Tax=Tessaracoccus antarcticus TaxID=2479848 RepID=A0A3M0GAH8_9ACTN|nr:N-formylglutamate amidohydrolase [Tessaracoccus antarcticus]RMB61428.1 N-formylglutamate amidohydrolase [Tessaracoccus antarcticus]